MEKYREKLKLDQRIFGILACVLLLFSATFALAEAELIPFPIPATGDSHWQSLWRGFCSGAAFGVTGCILFGLYRIRKALKNEGALKKLYIQDHDERTIQIWTAARAAAFQVSLLVGLVAIIISGYFNAVVSMTILACVLATCLIAIGFKIYYSRKF